MNKMNKKIIAACVALVGVGAVWALSVAFSNYNMTFKANWGFSLPSGIEEIYEKCAEASFQGDGDRYHVFSFKSEDSNKISQTMLEFFKKNKCSGVRSDCDFEEIREALLQLGIDQEYKINLIPKKVYKLQKDDDVLYVAYDLEGKLYVLERFM